MTREMAGDSAYPVVTTWAKLYPKTPVLQSVEARSRVGDVEESSRCDGAMTFTTRPVGVSWMPFTTHLDNKINNRKYFLFL
jgi:hypothetical protein